MTLTQLKALLKAAQKSNNTATAEKSLSVAVNGVMSYVDQEKTRALKTGVTISRDTLKKLAAAVDRKKQPERRAAVDVCVLALNEAQKAVVPKAN